MANNEQLEILKQGSKVWNKWRETRQFTPIDLSNANLSKLTLEEVDLRGANLSGVNLYSANITASNLESANLINANLTRTELSRANLFKADLKGATLKRASLGGADLRMANLSNANLWGAFLREANLNDANLDSTDLRKANLREASFIRTSINNSNISGSLVYGINVWDLKGDFDEQKDLVITSKTSSAITVDNIKVAQFIYLILNNEEIRDAINTLTSKTVLILGRFAIAERKMILDALRNKLREYNLLPIVFDFDRPSNKDFTETIKTLAGLSYFVIADITNPKSSPLELQATIPDYQVPFVPIFQDGERPFAMMGDLQKKYPWVLDTLTYDSIDSLINTLKPAIIDPAIELHNKISIIKAYEPKIRSVKDFM